VIEVAANEFRRTSPSTYVYEGRISVRGTVVPLPDHVVTINGDPAPAGLELGTLKPDLIELTVSAADGSPIRANTPKGAPKKTLMNVVVGAP
jgi:hypothetical protein